MSTIFFPGFLFVTCFVSYHDLCTESMTLQSKVTNIYYVYYNYFNTMDYEKIPEDDVIQKLVTELSMRGVVATIVGTKEEALNAIQVIIPAGASVMNGSSTTLKEIGFVDLLKEGKHGWNNIHSNIVAETDSVKQTLLRKQSILADYFLGSVHAVTRAGQVVVASASGSQIPSYAFSSDNVVWVVSANKIVETLEDAFTRIKDFVFPLEDARMKSTGAPGSVWAKTFIFEREIMPNRKVHMILVKEKLGF